ncbi:MAG TPA: Crp/Fnr family transcriptional regulator [Stellaceae bacterium]|nr:Crp/Fnr family transcriptional regulator [Stellaceae bacterium]
MPNSADTPDTGAVSLSGIHLLREVPETDRKALEDKCTFRRFSAGDVIVARFSVGSAVYFMLSGTGRVVHYLPGEDEITIAIVSEGDTVGEIAAIDGLGRSATIIADQDCVVAELARTEFRDLVVKHGEVAFALLYRWAAIIRELDDKFSYVSTIGPDQRVYSQLVRLARREQADDPHWVVRELPSHQDLAEWAQTSRESVAAAISELYRRGIAERKQKSLMIHDYAMLKSLILSGRTEVPNAAAGEG